MKKIKIIITGGTFEKEYNEIAQEFSIVKTQVPELLKKARSRLVVSSKILFLRDSKEFGDSERISIMQECKLSEEEHIVIIHGTDSMTKTAAILGKNIRNKTIILTGAMIPACFPNSDAEFNLGAAMAFVQSLQKGVYVAMNGRYFRWDDVQKDNGSGFFRRRP
ncbi:asparaginase [Candidatus Woesearchaeota archaeon]|nr:asparaginase [Candidatus Woesearchaeota archaeon]